MQVRLTRSEIEEALSVWVIDKLMATLTGEAGVFYPGVKGITLHETGQAATVDIEWLPGPVEEMEVGKDAD